jgi:hypothetical protein
VLPVQFLEAWYDGQINGRKLLRPHLLSKETMTLFKMPLRPEELKLGHVLRYFLTIVKTEIGSSQQRDYVAILDANKGIRTIREPLHGINIVI